MKQNKKILFIDTTQGIGGAIRSLSIMIKILEDEGYITHVIYTGEQCLDVLNEYRICAPKTRITYPSFQSMFSSSDMHLNSILHLPVIQIFLTIIVKILVIILQVVYVLKVYCYCCLHKVDLIHHNAGIKSCYCSMWVSKLHGIPCICHQRGYVDKKSLFGKEYLIKNISHFIAVSKFIKNNLMECGISGDKISIMYNVLDINTLSVVNDISRNNSNYVKVGLIANISPQKGHDIFIKSARIVLETFPDTLFYIVGGVVLTESKDFEIYIRTMAKETALRNKIIFTGHVKDVFNVMRAMDIIVAASVQPEAFSRVIIEAMYLGKPIVATRLGGSCEIIQDRINGLFIAPANEFDMSDKIKELLSDRLFAMNLGKNGNQTIITNFTVANQRIQINHIYDQILDDESKKNE